jgi:hypothetical protein
LLAFWFLTDTKKSDAFQLRLNLNKRLLSDLASASGGQSHPLFLTAPLDGWTLTTKQTKNAAMAYYLQNHRNEGQLRSVASLAK